MPTLKRALLLDREFTLAQVAAVFPNAVPTRKEEKWGWIEILQIGLIQVHTNVFIKRHGTHRKNTVTVEIRGVRSKTDNSTASLWHAAADGRAGLTKALQRALEHLLGIAAGILFATGDDQDLPAPPAQGAPGIGTVDDSPDTDELDDILGLATEPQKMTDEDVMMITGLDGLCREFD